jgi:hypothetical protein
MKKRIVGRSFWMTWYPRARFWGIVADTAVFCITKSFLSPKTMAARVAWDGKNQPSSAYYPARR